MKIALFSQSLFALSLEDAIRTTAEVGFEAIELACVEPHLDHDTAVKHPAAIARQIRDAGLNVAALSLFNNFTEPADAHQVEMAKAFIALAPLFQTKLLKLTPGPPASRDAEERQWHHLADALDELVPAARKTGVRLAFETHMRQLTDTLASSERFLALAPADCVGLTVDFSNLSFAGEDMSQVISRLGSRIYHTHVKNGWVDAQGRWHFGPLDTGLTDYARVLSLLQAAGYGGYLSIECLGPDARTDPAGTARRDLARLQRYLQDAGGQA